MNRKEAFKAAALGFIGGWYTYDLKDDFFWAEAQPEHVESIQRALVSQGVLEHADDIRVNDLDLDRKKRVTISVHADAVNSDPFEKNLFGPDEIGHMEGMRALSFLAMKYSLLTSRDIRDWKELPLPSHEETLDNDKLSAFQQAASEIMTRLRDDVDASGVLEYLSRSEVNDIIKNASGKKINVLKPTCG